MASKSSTQTQRAFSSSPSSSSSTPPCKYDVFLSFYGQDTRKSFTDHLYAGLIEKSINVFRDDERLERGKYISEELWKAIAEFFCAVFVISENYGFSKWCLNELAKIVECKKDRGLIVYPSDVRNQRKSFEKAFCEFSDLKMNKRSHRLLKKKRSYRSSGVGYGGIGKGHECSSSSSGKAMMWKKERGAGGGGDLGYNFKLSTMVDFEEWLLQLPTVVVQRTLRWYHITHPLLAPAESSSARRLRTFEFFNYKQQPTETTAIQSFRVYNDDFEYDLRAILDPVNDGYPQIQEKASNRKRGNSFSFDLTPRSRYDVFLNFYDQDTSNSFTDHPYAALIENDIAVFRHDEELGRGKYISEKLLKALEEFRYAVLRIFRGSACYLQTQEKENNRERLIKRASPSSSTPRSRYHVFLSFYQGKSFKIHPSVFNPTFIRGGMTIFRDDEELRRGKYISELMVPTQKFWYEVLRAFSGSAWYQQILETEKEKFCKLLKLEEESEYVVCRDRLGYAAYPQTQEKESNRERLIKIASPSSSSPSPSFFSKLTDHPDASSIKNILLNFEASWFVLCRDPFAAYPQTQEKESNRVCLFKIASPSSSSSTSSPSPSPSSSSSTSSPSPSTSTSSGKKRKKEKRRASPSPSPSPSSSSSTRQWKYDVFLSFYGQDTRKSFTDHLYAGLIEKGINVFRDDEELGRGKDISEELLKAIEESLYAVVVISENYAFSKWCLNELAKIVECRRSQTGLTVVPVFYHVDPSDVRNQKRSFEKAFAIHKEVDEEKKKTWRAALRDVANTAGWHVHYDRYESQIVKEIVESIFFELPHIVSPVSEGLVGIESRVEEVMKLLHIGEGGVRLIGIHGMGGVGKTTLAQVIYDMVLRQFEVRCFISCKEEDRSGTNRRIYRPLNDLQNQLISKICMGMQRNLLDDRDRISVISTKLNGRKVFLVLDDVDREEEIKALAWSTNWFGEGSRIILTSRDVHLLNRHATDSAIYEVKMLDDYEALQLFSLTVFNRPNPIEDDKKLCMKYVKYAQGLPLALIALGSHMSAQTLHRWKKTDEIYSGSSKVIETSLEISFDGLEESEKEIFLDIACFFQGSDLVSIIHKLESLGYFPNISIDVLRGKSLVTISRGRLLMHGLLKKMGRQIVYRESSREPGQRSRLWHWKDVLDVLENKTGTVAVQGMVLDFPNSTRRELRLDLDGFSNMRRLRMLKIGNIDCVKNVSELYDKLSTLVWRGKLSKFVLPDGLRIMEWGGCSVFNQTYLPYPLKSLPASFKSHNLVELSMPCSPIEQLWKGFKSLEDLKIIDLRGSQNLIEIPDFTGVPNLQRLELEGCTSLSKLHSSVGFLKRLKRFNLRNCKCLKSLPDMISLESLEFFDLSSCSRLDAFPAILGNMTSLEILLLSHCSRLFEPEDLSGLVCLKSLNMDETAITQLLPKSCKDVSFGGRKSWDSHFHCHLLQKESLDPNTHSILNSLSDLSSLISLDLSYCNLSDGAIPNDLGHLSSLEIVNLSGNKFARIPDSICQLSNLESLYLIDCSRLQALPKLPSSLTYLYVENCPKLEESSDLLFTGTLSEKLALADCSLAALYIDYDGGSPCSILQLDLRKHLETEGHWRRFFGTKVICGSWLGPGIPKWFNNKSASSSVKLEMHPDLNDNREWKGCALFVVYEVHEHHKSSSMIFESADFVYHFETDKGHLDIPFVLPVPKVTSVGATGFWVYIPAKWFLEQYSKKLGGWSYIDALILSDSLAVEVKECGIGLVCSEHDALEFYEALNIIGQDLDLETYHPPLYRL